MANLVNRALRYVGDLAYASTGEGDRPAGLPGHDELRRYMTQAVLAAAPALALVSVQTGGRAAALCLAAFAGGRLVELTAARARHRPSHGGSLTVAVLLSLVLPVSTPLWLAMAAAAFGTLFAREAFGGTGHNVFSPVLTSQALVVVSYPVLAGEASVASLNLHEPLRLLGHSLPFSHWALCAVCLGGIWMLVTRAVDPRTIAGLLASALGVVVTLGALGLGEAPAPLTLLTSGGFLAIGLLVAADPSTSPATPQGRVAYGLLIGGLAAVIATFSGNADYMMFAVLLGNMVAPTLDAAVSEPNDREAEA
jgi:Na+-translocating ferredoxin:NAD+ oxidoreductase RnfD subunit